MMLRASERVSFPRPRLLGRPTQAISQLDQMTQQNSSLVDQSAAASQSLREQATGLAEVVQVFMLAPPSPQPV
jgi:hypothetical protein